MKNLETIKTNVSNNVSVDFIKEYNMQADVAFGKELVPLIYNEMLTYACDPKLKFGEYEPKHSISSASTLTRRIEPAEYKHVISH